MHNLRINHTTQPPQPARSLDEWREYLAQPEQVPFAKPFSEWIANEAPSVPQLNPAQEVANGYAAL